MSINRTNIDGSSHVIFAQTLVNIKSFLQYKLSDMVNMKSKVSKTKSSDRIFSFYFRICHVTSQVRHVFLPSKIVPVMSCHFIHLGIFFSFQVFLPHYISLSFLFFFSFTMFPVCLPVSRTLSKSLGASMCQTGYLKSL